jgi:hypothetical protein
MLLGSGFPRVLVDILGLGVFEIPPFNYQQVNPVVVQELCWVAMVSKHNPEWWIRNVCVNGFAILSDGKIVCQFRPRRPHQFVAAVNCPKRFQPWLRVVRDFPHFNSNCHGLQQIISVLNYTNEIQVQVLVSKG